MGVFSPPPPAPPPPPATELPAWGAGPRGEIEPGMHRGASEKWIGAHSEAGLKFDFADHGLSIWHQRQRAVETLDLGAADVDTVKLAIKRAGVGGKFHRHKRPAHARGGRCRL